MTNLPNAMLSKLGHAFVALCGLALMAGAAVSQAAPRTYTLPEETAHFRPGPDAELAQTNCIVCHSADYIAMQPPGRGKAFWTAEVDKMVKVYGAPITPEDAGQIAAYLSSAY